MLGSSRQIVRLMQIPNPNPTDFGAVITLILLPRGAAAAESDARQRQ